jgi:hypothetical protein
MVFLGWNLEQKEQKLAITQRLFNTLKYKKATPKWVAFL